MLIDEIYCRMPFKDMDVSMPISSGRACMASGAHLRGHPQAWRFSQEHHNCKEIRLYARHGVYFYKGYVLPPGSVEVDPSSPFARRG
jgi:hypothetical protein